MRRRQGGRHEVLVREGLGEAGGSAEVTRTTPMQCFGTHQIYDYTSVLTYICIDEQ